MTRSRRFLARLSRRHGPPSARPSRPATATLQPSKPTPLYYREAWDRLGRPHTVCSINYIDKNPCIPSSGILLFLLLVGLLASDGSGGGARGAVLKPLARLRVVVFGERHVLGLLHEVLEVALGQVELHEVLNRRVILEGLRVHVYEQGPRQRILTRVDAIRAGCDAVDRERLEALLVLL